MKYWQYIWNKIRFNPIQKVLLDGLAKCGIRIEPFYLFKEDTASAILYLERYKLSGYKVEFFSKEDMKSIADIPYRFISIKELLSRLEKGNLCAGIKHDNSIVAFIWCDLDKCSFKGYPFHLKQDEVYIFDRHTVNAYRGRGIALQINYFLYQELARMGRTKIYSICHRFNKPALRFKHKLKPELQASGCYIELFNKVRHTVGIKKGVSLMNKGG